MSGEDMINEGAPDWLEEDPDLLESFGMELGGPECSVRDENGWPTSQTCDGCRYERDAVHAYLENHPEDSDLPFEALFSKAIDEDYDDD